MWDGRPAESLAVRQSATRSRSVGPASMDRPTPGVVSQLNVCVQVNRRCMSLWSARHGARFVPALNSKLSNAMVRQTVFGLSPAMPTRLSRLQSQIGYTDHLWTLDLPASGRADVESNRNGRNIRRP